MIDNSIRTILLTNLELLKNHVKDLSINFPDTESLIKTYITLDDKSKSEEKKKDSCYRLQQYDLHVEIKKDNYKLYLNNYFSFSPSPIDVYSLRLDNDSNSTELIIQISENIDLIMSEIDKAVEKFNNRMSNIKFYYDYNK